MHPQTLRIYERKGLIEPARTVGRSRRYSDRDIALLRRIQELTNEGVGLAGVRRILELEDTRRRAAPSRSSGRRRDARDAVERVHRTYRRDLVPLPPDDRPDPPAARLRTPPERDDSAAERRLGDSEAGAFSELSHSSIAVLAAA